MNTSLPEDPYHALGLPRDATAAAIKTAYRKLALKHHPDKVLDESLKTSAADLFHKIQAAWETIGDEEKRTRYDAQARLATLREAMERDRVSSRDMRPPPPQAYREEARPYDSRESPRSASYRTEEIRPFDTDYFEKPRRDYDIHERSRQTPPRSKPVRQDSKETERARRRESTKQSSRATARDRDYKYAQAEVESDSDSDRHRRSPRETGRERYHEQTRRQHEEASSKYYDERVQQKSADAREYMERLKRRPSPTRTSSREHEYVRGEDGRPVAFRRGSGRPKQSSRDDVDARPRRRELERSSSELEDSRRIPSLAQTTSAPYDIRLPYEKTRAASVQHARAEMADFAPSPVKRADSMPLQPQSRGKPVRQSTLRQTQTSDDIERRRPAGRSKEYLDDFERPTPDGYVLETRRPSRKTQSPENYSRRRDSSSDPYRPDRTSSRRDNSPEPDRSGRAADRGYSRRDASVEAVHSRPPRTQSPGQMPSGHRPSRPQPTPLNTRTTSTTYAYSPGSGVEQLSSTRPKLSRGESGRKDSGHLFGEIPRQSSSPSTSYTVPPEHVRYREVRPDFKVQTSRRTSEVRSPGYVRGSSFHTATPPMSA